MSLKVKKSPQFAILDYCSLLSAWLDNTSRWPNNIWSDLSALTTPDLKGSSSTKTPPLPLKKLRGDANHFLSIRLFVCVRIDWGVMGGGSYPFTLYGCRPQWSCLPTPHSYSSRATHSYTHTHTMAWDLLTQAIFSPCPPTLLPFSSHDDQEFSWLEVSHSNMKNHTWIDVLGQQLCSLLSTIISHLYGLNSLKHKKKLSDCLHYDKNLKNLGSFGGIWSPQKIPRTPNSHQSYRNDSDHVHRMIKQVR